MMIKAQAATASCGIPFRSLQLDALSSCARRIRSTKGLLIGLLGWITLALIAVRSTPLSLFEGPLPPYIRTSRVSFEEDDVDEGNRVEYESRIKQVFQKASMPNRTVILTTLNGAWANQGTMINMFLESFWVGYGTQKLLQHLIFICIDEKAYEKCLVIHPHCLRIKTHEVDLSQEQILLTKNYIKLVWRRIKFLKTVVELNFNFIFTDIDVVWFRDPFPLLQNDIKADIQIASDQYNKNPWDIHNKPNTGFMYVRANERTVSFLKYWYEEKERNSSLATQGIFNMIKFDETFKNIGMKLRFLDPQLFGGFCTISNTDMTKSITMHATCCKGLEAKLIDLRMILNGWKKWQQLHLEPKYLQFSKSEGTPTINQSTLQSCNVGKLKIIPYFDAPSACRKTFPIKSPRSH